MNLKITKRVISMLCATVMVASSMGASVGAINIVQNSPQNFKDAVLKLNKTLQYSTNGLIKLKNNIKKLKLDNQNNNEVSTKLENIIAKLSEVIDKIENWDDYYIKDENLVDEIQKEITNLNDQIIQLNSNCLLNQPNLVIQNSTDIFNKIDTINNKLLEENQKFLLQGVVLGYIDDNNNNNNNPVDLRKAQIFDSSSDDNNNIQNIATKNELDNKYKEYYEQVQAFRAWKASKNIDPKSDITYNSRNDALKYYGFTKNYADYFVVKKFSALAKKSCEEMEEFKNKTLDIELAKEIREIENSNEPTKQKIEKIINILENKKFNDYNRQLNIILPIVDSLHIAGDANANIVENKNLRNQLKKFLLQSVEEKINEKIKVYNENEITKPMANYINNVKSDIAESSVNTVITATFHGKYVNAEQLFDIVNMNLSLCEEDFKNSANDKNMVKDIDNLSFVKLLDNISNEKYTFDSKKESEKFDIMFRQYAKRITGMKTNLEKEAGYGENNGEEIADDNLIDFAAAVNKWGIEHLEEHYIRDRIVKDNLDDVLQKYKSLNDLKTKIDDAISARVNKDYQIGNPEDNEKEFKEAVNDAKKALNDLQKRVEITNNNKFVIVEN